MALYIDTKYVNLLSPYVRNYKYLGRSLWRFSCPICGDSATNQRKARGYFFVKNQSLIFKCQNCGEGRNVSSFLRELNQELYKQYNLETFLEGKNSNIAIFTDVVETATVVAKNTTIDLPLVSTLPETHRAKQLLLSRKLPDDMLSNFFYAQNFKLWMHSMSADYYPDEESRKKDYARIVIPYYDENKVLYGFSCRSLGSEMPKYINGKLDKSADLIYGLDKVNYNKRVYVVEGPIDSMFIDNSLAVSGSSFLLPKILSIPNKVLCYDNEKRKKETIKKMENSIEAGHTIYIPPDNIYEKDINDLFKKGYTKSQIKSVIDNNTYQGLYAKLRFVSWRKI